MSAEHADGRTLVRREPVHLVLEAELIKYPAYPPSVRSGLPRLFRPDSRHERGRDAATRFEYVLQRRESRFGGRPELHHIDREDLVEVGQLYWGIENISHQEFHAPCCYRTRVSPLCLMEHCRRVIQTEDLAACHRLTRELDRESRAVADLEHAFVSLKIQELQSSLVAASIAASMRHDPAGQLAHTTVGFAELCDQVFLETHTGFFLCSVGCRDALCFD